MGGFDYYFFFLCHQLLVPWWVPEIFIGHCMPAKMWKILTSVPLECCYWLTELIHVSWLLWWAYCFNDVCCGKLSPLLLCAIFMMYSLRFGWKVDNVVGAADTSSAEVHNGKLTLGSKDNFSLVSVGVTCIFILFSQGLCQRVILF